MKLGEHPIILPILAGIIRENAVFLRNYVMRRGVAATAADDLIQEAYLAVYRLEPRGEIQALLRDSATCAQRRQACEESLCRPLTALLVHYLGLQCLAYQRRQRWQQERLVELTEAVWPALAVEDRDLRRFLLEVGLLSDLDVGLLEQGDRFTTLKFWRLLAAKAGLDERERDFLLFKVRNPEARERDFSPNVNPSTVTRIKQSALKKIARFFR
jgi:hypothetical protein